MARVKRAVNAQKKRRVVLERASGYRGQRSRLYRKAKEQVTHSLGLRLPRPPGPQGRLPPALDPADQRRGPRQRDDLQPVHPGPQGRRDRGRPPDAGRARGQRRGGVHRAGRAGPGARAGTAASTPPATPPDRPESLPTTVPNAQRRAGHLLTNARSSGSGRCEACPGGSRASGPVGSSPRGRRPCVRRCASTPSAAPSAARPGARGVRRPRGRGAVRRAAGRGGADGVPSPRPH